MQLFDLGCAYCRWDDSLIGKEVLYADSISALEHGVQNMDTKGKVVGPSGISDVPFKIEGVYGTSNSWRYVYYDPNYDTKVAYYRDGKHVQFKSCTEVNWHDCYAEPCWDDNCEYRVKPDEPEEPEKHVVKAADLCGYCIHRKDGCTPTFEVNCINFVNTNDDYFRIKKDYDDLVKEHVELERKYGALVLGIQGLIRSGEDISDDAGQVK